MLPPSFIDPFMSNKISPQYYYQCYEFMALHIVDGKRIHALSKCVVAFPNQACAIQFDEWGGNNEYCDLHHLITECSTSEWGIESEDTEIIRLDQHTNFLNSSGGEPNVKIHIDLRHVPQQDHREWDYQFIHTQLWKLAKCQTIDEQDQKELGKQFHRYMLHLSITTSCQKGNE
jgi:hypothetical protein